MRLGFWEIVVVLVVALVLFGPNRLPEMGKSLGRALREFRQATSELTNELSEAQQALEIEPPRPAKSQDEETARATAQSAASGQPAAQDVATTERAEVQSEHPGEVEPAAAAALEDSQESERREPV